MRCEPHSASRHRRLVDFVSQLQRNRTSRAVSARETQVLHCRLIDADLHGTNARDCGAPPALSTDHWCHDDVNDVYGVPCCLSSQDGSTTIIIISLLLELRQRMDTKWTMTTGTQGRCHKGERGRGLCGPVCFPVPPVSRNFPGTPYHVVGLCWHPKHGINEQL